MPSLQQTPGGKLIYKRRRKYAQRRGYIQHTVSSYRFDELFRGRVDYSFVLR